jgi:alpha-tubulin suppressor-like RCC1 family protein
MDNTVYFIGICENGSAGCNNLQSLNVGIRTNKFIKLESIKETAKTVKQIEINDSVLDILNASSGISHEIIATPEHLLIKGTNECGQLGFGVNQDFINDYMVIPFENCKEVSCGDYNTSLLNTEGELYVTGKNNKGQLGLGHFNNITTLTKNETIEKVNHVKMIKDLIIIESDGNEIYIAGNYDPNFEKI